MMAAIQCKENNMQTVIIEHTAKLGTKILKTGNGKCNFSNTFMTKEMYQNNNADYAMRIINRFNVDDTIHFFEDLSVYKKERVSEVRDGGFCGSGAYRKDTGT